MYVRGEGTAVLGRKSCWRYFVLSSLETAGYTGTRLTCLLLLGVIWHIAFYLESPATSSSSFILSSSNPHSQTPLKFLFHWIFPFHSHSWDICSWSKSQESGLEGYSKHLRAAAIPASCTCLIPMSVVFQPHSRCKPRCRAQTSVWQLSGFHSLHSDTAASLSECALPG